MSGVQRGETRANKQKRTSQMGFSSKAVVLKVLPQARSALSVDALGGIFNDVSQHVVPLYSLRTIFGLSSGQLQRRVQAHLCGRDELGIRRRGTARDVSLPCTAREAVLGPLSGRGGCSSPSFDDSLGHRASISPRVSTHHATFFCSTAALLSERPPFRSTINPRDNSRATAT